MTKADNKSARYEIDMTSGAILPKLLRFAVPLILTGILQLLYNAADIVVVGRFAGAQALAAVGSTGSIITLLINICMGLSVGANVTIARAFGAGDVSGVQRGVHTSITIAAIGGVVMGIIGFVFARPLLEMMGSPDDVIDGATLYMQIYFIGLPANMLYNFGASVLRAVGDTRRPLYYLTISGVANVALNLVLVIRFNMSVAGVAIATVASQVISMALVLTCLVRTTGSIHLDVRQLRIHMKELKSIVAVGLPAGIQSSLFAISNVLIQSAVNSFGSIAMAGNAAAGNLEGFIWQAMYSIHQSDMTFASQNMGARRYDRVRRVMWICQATVLIIGFAMGMAMFSVGEMLLGIYNSDPEVIRFGMIRLTYVMTTYCICGAMDTLVGQMRGIGSTIVPMIISLTGACLLRIIWLWTVFAANPTLETLYLSYPISWLITWIGQAAAYFVIARRKLPRTFVTQEG